MKKGFWFWTHWLLGIVLGVIIAIIGFTGAALSFQDEILTFLNKEVLYTQSDGKERLSIDELLRKVNEKFENHRINSVSIASDQEVSVRINVSAANSTSMRGNSYYINPYTAEVLPGVKGTGFFRTMIEWHRWLGGTPGGIGKQIVAISTVALIILACTGLYLYLPRLRHKFLASLKIDFKKKGIGFLYKLHGACGVWTLIFVLLMSFTGLFWSYEWYRNGLYAIAKIERGGMHRTHNADTNISMPRTDNDNVEAAKAFEFFKEIVKDDYYMMTMSLPKAGGTAFNFSYYIKEPQHSRAINQLQLDTKTKEILKHAKYEDKSIGEKFISSIFPLHSGDFFGMTGLILYFISSLAMVLFAVTGYMLYYKRSFKRKNKG